MFELIEGKEPEEPDDTNYTGVIVGAICIPFYFLFWYLGGPDRGLSAFITLGVAFLAVGIRWELKKEVWFWLTIVAVLLVHVPVVLKLHWHIAVNRMTLLPIGLIDLLIDLGLIKVVEKFIVRYKAPDLEDEA